MPNPGSAPKPTPPDRETVSDPMRTVTHAAAAGESSDAAQRQASLEAAGERFRVVREHARGGLGQIFVARDRQLGREVALKEIQPALADDPASQHRFVLEAEVTGNLEHPGFVPVYALGRYADGRPFYAMRLIRGDSLKEAISQLHKAKRSSKAEFVRGVRPLLRRLVDVCNAMAYAHNRGVIHRDLKPANILLGPYGETLVVDWGLAKVLAPRPGNASQPGRGETAVAHEAPTLARAKPPITATSTDPMRAPSDETTANDSRDVRQGAVADATTAHADTSTEDLGGMLTSSGPVTLAEGSDAPWLPTSGSGEGHTLPGRAVGTPAYMSPEQAAGALDRIGPTTDIYSLGATLYCMLTGRPPFGESGEVHTVLIQVQTGTIPPPHALAAHVPKALEAICLKALARDPADRYKDMTRFAADLECFLDDEPVQAYREPISARLTRWMRRHKAWAMALLATLLAIVTIFGLSADGYRRSAQRERQAREHGLRVAAKFAARTVAAEIDRRWRILEDEVDEPAFVNLFQAALDKPVDSAERRALQAWLEKHFADHQRFAVAANWFLTDKRGTQIARAPLIEKSIGVNYAYRDYFHGRGRDLPSRAGDIEPLSRPHKSIVFQSRNTGRYMVVFSIPVRRLAPIDARFGSSTVTEIIGVIGMSVDVGRFGVLQLEVGNSQLAVLADLQPDETGKRGLMLHHPGMVPSKQSMVYLSPQRVSKLEAQREAGLARARSRNPLKENVQDGSRRAQPLPNSFASDYVDPVGGAYAGHWLAAFEPVIIQGRPDMIDDTGWVVIVQERADEIEIGPEGE